MLEHVKQPVMTALLTLLSAAATGALAPAVLAADLIADALGDPLPDATATGEPGSRWLAELGVAYDSVGSAEESATLEAA